MLAALTARLAADPADPVTLLGVLKHPRVRLGLPWEGGRDALRTLETRALRGARPRDWEALARRVEPRAVESREGRTAADHAARVEQEAAQSAACRRLLDALEAALAPLLNAFTEGRVSAPEAARAQAETLEALARDDAGQLGGLWAGPDGEAAAALFAGLIHEGEGLPAVDASGWAVLMETLLRDETVRTSGATHPRVRILGAIEARLVGADRLILAGLEEGVWPRAAAADPFLSRPMRAQLGLPSPERRIGLQAHDFAQAACAEEVVLLHTERRGGSPTVQSRWLWRLSTLVQGAGLTLRRDERPLRWAEALDAPEATPRPARRPRPAPPVADRPAALSVTRVETWVRNPYEIYAREVLGLQRLDPPDAPLEAAKRGTAIHAAVERFAAEYEDMAEAEREGVFAAMLEEALAEAGIAEQAQARERVLALKTADWMVRFEAERRRDGRALLVERRGAWALDVDGEPFGLSAKSDRIELAGGVAHVLDFKTGRPPGPKEVTAGFAPQLTLTAAILAHGGFEGVAPTPPGELAYVRITGRNKGGRPHAAEVKVVVKASEASDAVDDALAGLARRVRLYRDPATPYPPWTAPKLRKHASDYDHLARVWEWMTLGSEDEAAG